MDDFSALAARIVDVVDDVRGCLVLSRDAMVLAACPETSEAETTASMTRFLGLGGARRGFLELEDETWCYVRHDACAAFVVTGPASRPGLVIAQLDRALDRFDGAGLGAGETGTRSVRAAAPRAPGSPVPTLVIAHRDEPDAAGPPSGPSRRLERPDVRPQPARPSSASAAAGIAPPAAMRPIGDGEPPSGQPISTSRERDGQQVERSHDRSTKGEDEVDEAEIAKEFAGLLQDRGSLADW
jgi:hypothetical protein